MERRGFTLIEVLVVLGVISILAGIAIPRFNAIRDRAFVSTMTGDLHSLRLAQELYYRSPDNDYASSLDELGDSYSTSPDVTVTIDDAGADHFSATATHPGTPRTCRYTTAENLIVCTEAEEGGKDGGK